MVYRVPTPLILDEVYQMASYFTDLALVETSWFSHNHTFNWYVHKYICIYIKMNQFTNWASLLLVTKILKHCIYVFVHWCAICNLGGRHYNVVIDVLQLILNLCIGIMKLLQNINYIRCTQSVDEGLYEIMEMERIKLRERCFAKFVYSNISTRTHRNPRRREILVNYLISVNMWVLKLYYRFSSLTSSLWMRKWLQWFCHMNRIVLGSNWSRFAVPFVVLLLCVQRFLVWNKTLNYKLDDRT